MPEEPDNGTEDTEQGESGRLIGDDDDADAISDYIDEQLGEDEDEETEGTGT